MTYCGEGNAPAAGAFSPHHVATLERDSLHNHHAFTCRVTAVVLARLRIHFGITHCRSSACSVSVQPPDLRWYLAFELHWLNPTAQSRATCRAGHVIFLASSEQFAIAAPFHVSYRRAWWGGGNKLAAPPRDAKAETLETGR